MSLLELALTAGIVLAVFFALRGMRRRRKRGCACCCAECGGNCRAARKK